MSLLWVYAKLELQPGADRTDAVDRLQGLAAQTLALEPGCHVFDVRADLKDPACFVLWEAWDDDDALTAHHRYPHTRDYVGRNLTQPVVIQRLETVSPSWLETTTEQE